MMRTTGLLVVFSLFVILYQTSAVPVASSYRLENENVMDVMEAKEKSEEASDEEKEEGESDKEEEEEKHDDKEDDKDDKDDKEDEEKKDDREPKDDEELKEDEEKKDDEGAKDDEEAKDDEDKKEDKEEDEQEPDLNEEQNDASSGEESVDLDSDHLVLQGSGNGKIKGVVIDESEKEKDKPEKRSVDSQKKSSKATQDKRCGFGGCGCGGCGDAFDSGGCDYMGGGCGGAYGGVYGHGACGGCGGCGGCCGTNDWCAGGTMCSNCKGGFGPPVTCSGCNTGCCPSLTFPCAFGATVNNPGCECCKEKTPPGKCKWPCMWPCCCTCTPPKFEFKPLKPEPVCHCPSPHSHHTACGNHCLKRTLHGGPVKRSLMNEAPSTFLPTPYSYGYAPIMSPFYNGAPFPRPF